MLPSGNSLVRGPQLHARQGAVARAARSMRQTGWPHSGSSSTKLVGHGAECRVDAQLEEEGSRMSYRNPSMLCAKGSYEVAPDRAEVHTNKVEHRCHVEKSELT